MCSNFLRFCYQELYAPERMTPDQVADVIATCCEYVLAGPNDFVAQMREGAPTSWQSSMFMGRHGVSGCVYDFACSYTADSAASRSPLQSRAST
jgi:hypothetical protein